MIYPYDFDSSGTSAYPYQDTGTWDGTGSMPTSNDCNNLIPDIPKQAQVIPKAPHHILPVMDIPVIIPRVNLQIAKRHPTINWRKKPR